MTEKLWSNKRIIDRALEHAGNGIQPHIAWERTAREMRDEYERVHFSALDRIRVEMQEARAVPATEKYAGGLLRALEILLESEKNDE